MFRILLVLMFLVGMCLPARAQEECEVNGYPCLRLTAVCSQQWRASNPNDFEVEALWQIWSSYESPADNDPDTDPIILYEGTLHIRARGSVNFRTPVSRPVLLVWGPAGGGAGPLAPSTRNCSTPPPRSCTNVFKIMVPEELRSEGAQFVIYNVGDEFLDTYTDDDLGFDIQMGTINVGEVALLLCQDAWPGARSFVGMVEAGGTRTPIIEFSLGAEWPEVVVFWTAPGVTNAE